MLPPGPCAASARGSEVRWRPKQPLQGVSWRRPVQLRTGRRPPQLTLQKRRPDGKLLGSWQRRSCSCRSPRRPCRSAHISDLGPLISCAVPASVRHSSQLFRRLSGPATQGLKFTYIQSPLRLSYRRRMTRRRRCRLVCMKRPLHRRIWLHCGKIILNCTGDCLPNQRPHS